MTSFVHKMVPHIPQLMKRAAQGDVSAIALLALAGIAAIGATIQNELNNK